MSQEVYELKFCVLPLITGKNSFQALNRMQETHEVVRIIERCTWMSVLREYYLILLDKELVIFL